MTAENQQDFDYESLSEPLSSSTRRTYWRLAEGLQRVDGLQTSAYLAEVAEKHSAGEYSIKEAGAALRAYYAGQGSTARVDGESLCEAGAGKLADQQEADLVSHRIVEVLERNAFFLVPDTLSHIHRNLFQDLDPEVYRPGEYKTEALVKSESILNGDSVLYADPSLLEPSLRYLFGREATSAYGVEFDEEQLRHFSQFIAHLWQIHPFVEGNTRTVAVFAVLYLNHLGFDVDNQPFEEHSKFFRDALVRANYRNAKAKVDVDLAPLACFLENMLCGARHELSPVIMI